MKMLVEKSKQQIMEICLDGGNLGSGLVVALRPPFKRFNTTIRRGASQRFVRRPASLLSSTDISHQGEDNGTVTSHNSTDGPSLWATSFERLLEDPFGLHMFAEFLKKEFSAENIYFWTACERYRRLTSTNDRIQEAQRIYQQHLCVGALEPVNVDCQARHCTEQCLQEAKIDLFDVVQKQIFNLMKFDSYPRFLKSQLYKECLNGDIDKPQFDAGLLIQPPTTPQSKLKKSLSNAEDRRRKSLLPWHRKNRSKSKDRGESEYSQKQRNVLTASSESVDGKSEVHSSKSSLTSLDLAITNSQDSTKGNPDEISGANRPALCRVILNNGSTTVVQIKQSETIQQLVNRLLEKRGLNYSAFEVYTDKHSKTVDINEPSSVLAGCEVTIDQRVVFKLDLPNRKVISVKSKCTKLISDVLRPILAKYNYNLDHTKVMLNETVVVDLTSFVTAIDRARLKILVYNEPKPTLPPPPPPPPPPQTATNPMIKINNVKVSKLEEITNQVFEGILQEKADSASIKSKCDKGSVKSEDWGSEHSSGIFGRFLRRDSGLHERKKKAIAVTAALTSRVKIDDVDEHNKKPLIAKWKTGVNKMQIASSESDELVEGLTRAQRSRLEDQRGTEINFELPDFLKDNNKSRKLQCENSRFYVSEYENRKILPSPPNSKNYENRNITSNNNNNSPTKSNNVRMYSPNSSNQSTPSKCGDSLENTVIENKKESPKSGEPPPLPPKPKIVPIKPSNWGQNGLNRNKEILIEKEKTMYLEQPSSSFV